MNKREVFNDYVKNGGEKFCSPQIGAGAGFDTKFAGKEWICETTFEDTISTVESFDIVPLLNTGCSFEACIPEIVWETTLHEKGETRIKTEQKLVTPAGTLSRSIYEDVRSGGGMLKYPVTGEDDLSVLEYYLDAAINADYSKVTEEIAENVKMINGRAALDVQWPVQPYELLCFPNTVDTVLLAADCPERFLKLMDKIVMLDEKLMKAVAKGGADFIFLGGPGSEMLSPRYYEDFIIPYSQTVTSIAHACGLMVYSHICSPIEPFLTMGFYNRMGIDLFETISPPPVGNVKSVKDALEKIDSRICTRGNVGLDVLLNSSKEEVKEKVFEILEQSRGRKHIVAASDYLFYNIPVENVHAMACAIKEWKG